MLHSLKPGDSCYDPWKYYKKHKRGEKVNLNVYLFNRGSQKVSKGFSKYTHDTSFEQSSTSLILPNVSNVCNNSFIQPIKEAQQKLCVVNILFKESSKYPDLSSKQHDLSHFISKVALYKRNIVEEIKDAFIIDSFYEQYKQQYIEERSKPYRKLRHKDKETSTCIAKAKASSFEIEPQLSLKYITYKTILSNVISHCIELRNEANSTLSVERISNSFDEEVLKIKSELLGRSRLAHPKVDSGSVSSNNTENFNRMVFNYFNNHAYDTTRFNEASGALAKETGRSNESEARAIKSKMKHNLDKEVATKRLTHLEERTERIAKIALHRNQFDEVLKEIDKQYKSHTPFITNKAISDEIMEAIGITSKISQTLEVIDEKVKEKQDAYEADQGEAYDKVDIEASSSRKKRSFSQQFNSASLQKKPSANNNGDSDVMSLTYQVQLMHENETKGKDNTTDRQDKSNELTSCKIKEDQMREDDRKQAIAPERQCSIKGSKSKEDKILSKPIEQAKSSSYRVNKSKINKNRTTAQEIIEKVDEVASNNKSIIVQPNEKKAEKEKHIQSHFKKIPIAIKPKNKINKSVIIKSRKESKITPPVIIAQKPLHSFLRIAQSIESSTKSKPIANTPIKVNYIELFNRINNAFQSIKYTLPKLNPHYSSANLLSFLSREAIRPRACHHSISFIPIRKIYHTPKRRKSSIESYKALVKNDQLQKLYEERLLMNKSKQARNNLSNDKDKDVTDKTDDQTYDMLTANLNQSGNDKDLVRNNIFYEPPLGYGFIRNKKSIFNKPIGNRMHPDKKDIKEMMSDSIIQMDSQDEDKKEHGLLKEYRQIKGLTPEEYANRMNDLFEKQLLNREETSLKLQEERMNGFKNFFANHLLQSKLIRMKTGNRLKFLNMSEFSFRELNVSFPII